MHTQRKTHTHTRACGACILSADSAGDADALDRAVAELLDHCDAHGTPVVYALSRRRLGHVVGQRQPASVAAVRRADGAEARLATVRDMAAARAAAFVCAVCDAAPTVAPPDGQTVLEVAARVGLASCVDALLASPGTSTAPAHAPSPGLLHAAARGGHVRVLLRLLRTGADPTAVDSDGRTALEVAHWHHHPRAVAALAPVSPAVNVAALAAGPAPASLILPASPGSSSSSGAEDDAEE
jgi:hypothetical protein